MSRKKTVRNVFFAIFCLFACVSLGYAECCSTAGAVQYKDIAGGCSYTTQTRTCCQPTSCQRYSFPPDFNATPCCADVSGAVID